MRSCSEREGRGIRATREIGLGDFEFPEDSPVPALARAFEAAGGRLLVVGGWVRDRIMGWTPMDLDLEVHGLEEEVLLETLGAFGSVKRVGQSFAVFRVKGLALQIGLPAAGRAEAGRDIAGALRRRDLTMNSMAWDPLRQELFDPFGGQRDLERRVLRATDPETFGWDPARALRVAQFTARFGLKPAPELVKLCADCDLAAVPGERLLEEFRKLLLLGRHPELGLRFLEQADLLRFFPELQTLVGVPQDLQWHGEGDVWSHTLLVLHEAAPLRGRGDFDDEALMFGALCHDFGKPEATRELEGRVVSHGHESAGIEPVERFLERLRAPKALARAVKALVRHHRTPVAFVSQGAGPKAYRRLARELAAAGVSPVLLERLARADQLGRTKVEDQKGDFPEGKLFLQRMHHEVAIGSTPKPNAVQGRHLMARGFEPGRDFGRILQRCREIQDETGCDDPDPILDRVLAEQGGCA